MDPFEEPDGWASRPIENADEEKDDLYERIEALEAKCALLAASRALLAASLKKADADWDELAETMRLVLAHADLTVNPKLWTDIQALLARPQ